MVKDINNNGGFVDVMVKVLELIRKNIENRCKRALILIEII